MSEKLKPCPFCGKMPEVEPNGDCYCDYYICPMAPDSYMPKDWNTRPIEDELNKRIAELEALVDELVNIGDNLFDSLNPIAWKHEWLDKWWKLSNCRRGEREKNGN